MAALRVDHVVWAVGDLETAAAQFRDEFGLGSVAGGIHPDWGTANRIVPLGREYLELVAVVDPERATGSDFGHAVLEALARGRKLVGWAVATDDLEGIAARLQLETVHGSRVRPDGPTLRWQLAGVAPGLSSGALPFFIQWHVAPELHPGAATVEHDARPRGIAWLEVATEARAVQRWLGDHELPLRITDGVPALSAVAIDTAAGQLVLPPSAGPPR